MVVAVLADRVGGERVPDIGFRRLSEAGGEGFSAVLAKTLAGSVNDLRKAESVAMKGLMGKASTHEVVNSLLAAERTLHAAISIRDRLVTSYQEISRMAI